MTPGALLFGFSGWFFIRCNLAVFYSILFHLFKRECVHTVIYPFQRTQRITVQNTKMYMATILMLVESYPIFHQAESKELGTRGWVNSHILTIFNILII